MCLDRCNKNHILTVPNGLIPMKQLNHDKLFQKINQSKTLLYIIF